MRIYTDGQMFKAVHISGPTHNYLGISFSDGCYSNIEVDAVAPEPGEVARIDRDDVSEEVMKGVEIANEDLGTMYKPKLIQFVLSDSPVPGIYVEMAKAIVITMHAENRR